MKREALLSILTLLLASCSVVPTGVADRTSGTPPRTGPVAAPSPAMRNSVPMRSKADTICISNLGRGGARFDAVPDRYFDSGCSTLGAVQMHALRGDDGELRVGNLGPVTCAVSTAFAAWARFGVDRAARKIFGAPLASIETMGSYSCRNVAGTGRRSAHASAAAIDIGGFTLADGRRIDVQSGWNGSFQEREFLRVVQQSACRRFGTVLGPDYNDAHRDHIHVEGVIDGGSYCR